MAFKTHFLNVGQGDTSLVELPNSQFMLVDCNQTEENTNILDYLKKVIPKNNDKHHIDYVVLTHPHKDHIKGLKDIIDDEEISVGEIWESGHRTRDDDGEYRNYIEIMNRNKPSIYKVGASSNPFAEFDDIRVYMFAPSSYVSEDDKEDPREAIHNRCMVMKIEYAGKSVLFTGDSSFSSWQERIVPNYSDENGELDKNLLSSDVLSVSHHGSRTFFMEKEDGEPYVDGLKKISPSVCVISVGKENDHGHPHDEAMEIYKRESDEVYLTKDEEGESIVVDIETLDVEIEEKKDLVRLITKHLLNDLKPKIEVYHSTYGIDNSSSENYRKIDGKKIRVEKNGSLYFKVANPKQNSEYKWIVKNSGRSVWQDWLRFKRATDLQNESAGVEAKRDLKWNGRHTMTCQEIQSGLIVSESVVKVLIK